MTLTDTRKALQDILEEATATDCAVCYVTDADEETLRSAIQAIDDMKKMQGMLKTAVDEIEKADERPLPCDNTGFKIFALCRLLIQQMLYGQRKLCNRCALDS